MAEIDDAIERLSAEELDLLNSDPQMLAEFREKYGAEKVSAVRKLASAAGGAAASLAGAATGIPGASDIARKAGEFAVEKPREAALGLAGALPGAGGMAGAFAGAGLGSLPLAALGAGAGEAANQAARRALGAEPAPAVSLPFVGELPRVPGLPPEASNIATQAGLGAGFEAGGKIAAGALQGAASLGNNLLEILAKAAPGTARSAAKAGQAPSYGLDAVKKYGQGIADAVKTRQREIGSALDDATSLYDALAPEGKIATQAIWERLGELNGSLARSTKSQAAKQQIAKALEPVESRLRQWVGEGRTAIGAREARSLLSDLREPVNFDATLPGSGDAKSAVKPLGEWLRGYIGRAYKGLDEAMSAYHQLVDDAEAVEKLTGVAGGEVIDDARAVEISKKLPGVLKAQKTAQEALEGIGRRLRSPGMDLSGARLAVAQQLSEPSSAAASGGDLGLATRLVGSATHPLARPAFTPLAKLVSAFDVPFAAGGIAGQGASAVSGLLNAPGGPSEALSRVLGLAGRRGR